VFHCLGLFERCHCHISCGMGLDLVEHSRYFAVFWSPLATFIPMGRASRFVVGFASSMSVESSLRTESPFPKSAVIGIRDFLLRHLNLVRCHASITISAEQDILFKISQ
jgi:hypothetical protein